MKSKYQFSRTIIIPDKIEECTSDYYEKKIEVNNFLPNQILLSENNFDKVCINMEHQVAGQLTIELVSPNGSTVNLLPDTTTNIASNGIGVIYKLGEPNITQDDLSNCQPANNPPGTGMLYCWSPDVSPDSTWHALLKDNKLEKTINPSDPTNNINVYSAYFNSFNNLKGSPLNGEWTLKVDDLSKGGNGYIFEWWIQFKENISPSNLIYRPEINFLRMDIN